MGSFCYTCHPLTSYFLEIAGRLRECHNYCKMTPVEGGTNEYYTFFAEDIFLGYYM